MTRDACVRVHDGTDARLAALIRDASVPRLGLTLQFPGLA